MSDDKKVLRKRRAMRVKSIDLWWPIWVIISAVLWYVGEVNIWTIILIALSHIHINANFE